MLDRTLLDDSNIKRIEELSERLNFRHFIHSSNTNELEMSTRHGVPILLRSLLKRQNVDCVEVIAESGTVSEVHTHAEVEIVIPYEGFMEFYMGDSVFNIEAGQCMYIPKNIPHSAKFPSADRTKMICITVPHSPDFPGEMDNDD